MDNLLKWISDNLKVVIFLLAGIIIFSVFLGLIIGLASKPKKSFNKELNRQLTKLEQSINNQQKTNKAQANVTFLIPPEVELGIDDIFNNKYGDELSYLLENLRLRHIKLSDLINERSMGETTSIKPVIFNSEEKNIITLKNEIIEP